MARLPRRLAVAMALLASSPDLRAQDREAPPVATVARPVHEVDLALGASWAGCYSSCRDEAAGPGFRLAYFYALSDPVSLGGGIDHARFSYGLSGGESDTASTTTILALFRVRPLQNSVADPYFELGLGLAVEAAPASPHGPANTDPRAAAALALGVPFLLTPALRLGPRFAGALTAGGRIGVSCVVTSTRSDCEVYRTSHNGFLFAGIEAGLIFDPSDIAPGP